MTLVLSAAFNVRDLGGLPTRDGGRVRDGVLWRGDTLHRLSPEDLAALGELGLRTVVDLRSPDEVEQHGRLPPEAVAAFHAVPVFTDIRTLPMPELPDDTPETRVSAMVDMYLQMLDIGGTEIARAIQILGAEGALPALFHCTAGKDRTGLVAAFILESVGVDDVTIAADYARTEESRPRASAWLTANDPDYAERRAKYPRWVMRSAPETMLGTLARIRAEHGSVRQLLLSLGVQPETLSRLRTQLIRPA